MLFATHGLCSAAAAWLSWRCRGASKSDPRQALETGWLLVGGWLPYALLGAASIGEPATDRPLTNSTPVALFLITAITATKGAGYTKYVEPREEAIVCDHAPIVGGLPDAARDTTLRLAHAIAAAGIF